MEYRQAGMRGRRVVIGHLGFHRRPISGWPSLLASIRVTLVLPLHQVCPSTPRHIRNSAFFNSRTTRSNIISTTIEHSQLFSTLHFPHTQFIMIYFPQDSTAVSSLGSCMELMEPANLSFTSPPSRLLDLPLELRRIIFGYALYTKTTLHEPTKLQHNGDVLIYPATNLLRVSSRIKEETLPIFYQVNHFHCEHFLDVAHPAEAEHMHPLPSIFLRALHMIRHISLNTRYGVEYRWCEVEALEENVLANALIHIERHAPNLRKLALHFVPSVTSRWSHSPFGHVSFDHGSTGRLIVTALCRFRARLQPLSLVYVGVRRALEELELHIAPRKEWTARILDSWPVTIRPVRINSLRGSDPNFQYPIWELSLGPELHAGDEEL